MQFAKVMQQYAVLLFSTKKFILLKYDGSYYASSYIKHVSMHRISLVNKVL
jgi:hypothetical protein